jgi:hypothetical protein
MNLKSVSALGALAVIVAGFGLPPAFAQDAMSSNSMMAGDPMAADCLVKAQGETDSARMMMMVEDCHKMYPDDMAATCLSEAMMEKDAAKMDMMVHKCHETYPDTAMGAMSGAM